MKNKVVEDYVDEDGCLHCGICMVSDLLMQAEAV